MIDLRGALLGLLMLAACAAPPRHAAHFLPQSSRWPMALPAGFAPPETPADDPFTLQKAEVGRHLFYDRRLSLNQTQSCASCHQQRAAFTDGRATAVGSTGEVHFRNSMTLANVAYRRPLTWADDQVTTLEAQVIVPLTNHHPVELGMDGRFNEMLQRLRNDPLYARLFFEAFPNDAEPINVANVTRALASFERTILSGRSPFDRYVFDAEHDALTESAKRGMRLFHSARLACSSCHGGRDLSSPRDGVPFQNNGMFVYARATTDRGLANRTSRRGDVGRIRVPTLRNVALTAPYMHDGSIATLEEVIDDYAAGGRVRRGSGRTPRGVMVKPFALSAEEKRDLLAFLESLTDEAFIHDQRLSDPW